MKLQYLYTRKFLSIGLILSILGFSLYSKPSNFASTASMAWNELFFGSLFFSLLILILALIFSKKILNHYSVLFVLTYSITVLIFGGYFGDNANPATLVIYILAGCIFSAGYHLFKKENLFLPALLLFAIACLLAQWGILQFILQEDLGFYLLGESRLHASIDGVAKFNFLDKKLVRAYGPFPHSNIYAGSLLLTTLPLLLLLTRVKTIPKVLKLSRPLLYFGGFIVLLALLLTFSRAAYISLIFIFTYLILRLPRMHYKLPKALPFLLLILCLFPFIAYRQTDTEDPAIHDRAQGLSWYMNIISDRPMIFGVGAGQYEHRLFRWLESNEIDYQEWDISPIHSTPLLLFIEFGILGIAALLLLLLFYAPHIFSFLTPITLLSPIFFLDHYFVSSIFSLFLLSLVIAYSHSLQTHSTT